MSTKKLFCLLPAMALLGVADAAAQDQPACDDLLARIAELELEGKPADVLFGVARDRGCMDLAVPAAPVAAEDAPTEVPAPTVPDPTNEMTEDVTEETAPIAAAEEGEPLAAIEPAAGPSERPPLDLNARLKAVAEQLTLRNQTLERELEEARTRIEELEAELGAPEGKGTEALPERLEAAELERDQLRKEVDALRTTEQPDDTARVAELEARLDAASARSDRLAGLADDADRFRSSVALLVRSQIDGLIGEGGACGDVQTVIVEERNSLLVRVSGQLPPGVDEEELQAQLVTLYGEERLDLDLTETVPGGCTVGLGAWLVAIADDGGFLLSDREQARAAIRAAGADAFPGLDDCAALDIDGETLLESWAAERAGEPISVWAATGGKPGQCVRDAGGQWRVDSQALTDRALILRRAGS